MKRLWIAAGLIVLGVSMFGVATGLVYLDMRRLPPEGAGVHAVDAPNHLVWAMIVGPLGAGLALAGGLVGLVELVAAFRKPRAAA